MDLTSEGCGVRLPFEGCGVRLPFGGLWGQASICGICMPEGCGVRLPFVAFACLWVVGSWVVSPGGHSIFNLSSKNNIPFKSIGCIF